MVTLTETIRVEPPVQALFSFVADFGNLARWDPGIVRSRKLTAGRIGPGTTFEVVALFAGREVPMTYEITEWDPPHRVVLEGHTGGMHALDTIRFEPHMGGTRIHYRADLTFRGLMRLFEPLLRGRLIRMGREAIAGLEEALDNGAVDEDWPEAA